MYVDADSIIKAAALIGAISAIVACLYKFFKWVDNQQAQDKAIAKLEQQHNEDIEDIKSELCVIVYGLFATLDGLKQQGQTATSLTHITLLRSTSTKLPTTRGDKEWQEKWKLARRLHTFPTLPPSL